MTKALLKKQLMEVFSWLYKDRKTGKHRSAQGIALYSVLYLVIFGSLGAVFYRAADILCEPLLSIKMGWLYWCLMGLISVFLGVFGSVFNTYSTLYGAKDNDLLFAMPIPVSRILIVRLLGVYAMGLMYELIVMIPTLLIWFMKAPFSFAGAICIMLIPFILSVFVLVLSSILGWVVALVSAKLKNKNIITVFISLIFIVVYYYAYAQAYSMLQSLLVNADRVGEKIKFALYPLYHMGLAAEGRIISMLIFTAVIGVLFLAVYSVLSRSFLGLATANKGASKKKHKREKIKTRSVSSALLSKELRRFTSSANYMLNCGLGIIFMPVAAVILVWKSGALNEMLADPTIQKFIPLLAVAAICVIATMNDITSPSISLEGKNLWLLQSLPVSAKNVLAAKLKLHLLLTLIPAIPLVAAVEWLIKPSPVLAMLTIVTVALFITLMATLGLTINLKIPILNWTSEIVPIKQSMSVIIALFGGWVIIIAFAGAYVLLQKYLSALAFLSLVCLMLSLIIIALLRWLFTKGAKIFSSL